MPHAAVPVHPSQQSCGMRGLQSPGEKENLSDQDQLLGPAPALHHAPGGRYQGVMALSCAPSFFSSCWEAGWRAAACQKLSTQDGESQLSAVQPSAGTDRFLKWMKARDVCSVPQPGVEMRNERWRLCYLLPRIIALWKGSQCFGYSGKSRGKAQVGCG